MPHTEILVQNSNDEGLIYNLNTPIDSLNGMKFINTGREILIVENTGGSSISITLNFADDRYGRGGYKEVAVEANETKIIGPFHPDPYNQTKEGFMYIDFSDNTGDLSVYRVSLS